MQLNSSNLNLKQYESMLKLKNGQEIFLRPIMELDRHLLVDLFNRMSPQSVYLRFLRHLNSLPESIINRLINIDYHSNFALVAVLKKNKKDAIVSIGRYGYDPDEDGTELAVAVRDDWQQVGLGKKMLSKVVSIAIDHGITNFIGMMDPQNTAIQKLLVNLGYKVRYSMESGFYRVEITV
ncbi:conserved hypothetical protein [Desulforapulum autotrophicum HRM2]|uniref:N-acetyltransferase domain-containing protein n=1 Tax=Desulforapulum autotrophicum (strain ATCC 43914 / DSM 3382 / VKM B-1955 / HRM2) TaxID=177437 RepID=C0QGN6_DESAH|nr:GNAT family N-acetyltransferase [Desulforapulum autotrophicum]ACN13511.1 conserved hypothetical protein [Desulforapulum autotrophicum HRM2]